MVKIASIACSYGTRAVKGQDREPSLLLRYEGSQGSRSRAQLAPTVRGQSRVKIASTVCSYGTRAVKGQDREHSLLLRKRQSRVKIASTACSYGTRAVKGQDREHSLLLQQESKVKIASIACSYGRRAVKGQDREHSSLLQKRAWQRSISGAIRRLPGPVRLETAPTLVWTLDPHPKGDGGEEDEQRYDSHQTRYDRHLGLQGFYLRWKFLKRRI